MKSRSDAGLVPLTPERKWRAIAVATVLFAPAFWALLGGLVAVATDDKSAGEAPAPAAAAIAFGLAMIPFVYIVLAFMSEHPRAPGAVVKAMLWCLFIGIPVSAVAGDAVTGIVAGVGAGGVVALRADLVHETKLRVYGVVVAAVYSFVMVRTAGAAALVAAPVFPFTALGLADHLSEWRQQRQTT